MTVQKEYDWQEKSRIRRTNAGKRRRKDGVGYDFWGERHRTGDGKILCGTRGCITLDPEWAHFYTAKAVFVRPAELPALTADIISNPGQSAFASLRTRELRPLAPLKRLSLNVTNTVFFNEKGGSIT